MQNLDDSIRGTVDHECGLLFKNDHDRQNKIPSERQRRQAHN